MSIQSCFDRYLDPALNSWIVARIGFDELGPTKPIASDNA